MADQHSFSISSKLSHDIKNLNVSNARRTLRRFMEDFHAQGLPFTLGLKIARDIAIAMDRLHKDCIVHRNLTPDSIILTKEDEIHIHGFEFARKKSPEMTTNVGSLRWRAPEVYKDNGEENRAYDHKADVYSFAMILYELVTNKTPYHEDDDDAVECAVTISDVRPEIDDNVPSEISFLIEACWDPEPAKRKEFCQIAVKIDEILKDLNPIIRSEPYKLVTGYEEEEPKPQGPLSAGLPIDATWFDGISLTHKGFADDDTFKIDERLQIDLNMLEFGNTIFGDLNSNCIVFSGRYKNCEVAIKELGHDPSAADNASLDKKLAQLLAKEVALLFKAQQENVVKVYGGCLTPRKLIITELMEGGTLESFLKKIRPEHLEFRRSLKYAIDVSEVMCKLHSMGMTHRDLKPANLLLSKDLEKIKLADFGTATLEKEMTEEVGTPNWTAPEVFERIRAKAREKSYTHKVDVYSFGFVLWEIVYNEEPYNSMEFTDLEKSYERIRRVVEEDKRPPLRDQRMDGICIPRELIELIKSSWIKEPTSRPEFSEIIHVLTTIWQKISS